MGEGLSVEGFPPVVRDRVDFLDGEPGVFGVVCRDCSSWESTVFLESLGVLLLDLGEGLAEPLDGAVGRTLHWEGGVRPVVGKQGFGLGYYRGEFLNTHGEAVTVRQITVDDGVSDCVFGNLGGVDAGGSFQFAAFCNITDPENVDYTVTYYDSEGSLRKAWGSVAMEEDRNPGEVDRPSMRQGIDNTFDFPYYEYRFRMENGFRHILARDEGERLLESVTYTVQVPGEITFTNGEEISGNKVLFNLFEDNGCEVRWRDPFWMVWLGRLGLAG